MSYIPKVNAGQQSIAKNIRVTLALGFVMSVILVAIIGLTSWYALKTLNDKIEDVVSTQVQTSHIYDMRIAATERNLQLTKMLLAEDEFDIYDEMTSFNEWGGNFLVSREAYKSQKITKNEERILADQREISKLAVALQYKMHELKLEGKVEEALEQLNEHLIYQIKVFSLLDELLSSQKNINKVSVKKAREAQSDAIRKVILLSCAVIIVIFFMTFYMVKRLSEQTADIENESVKFKALIEGSMDAVLVLEMHNVIDCNVNALNMFGVNSINEINSIGLDYYSKFSDSKSRNDSDEIFTAVNHVLVDSKRRYRWVFVNNDAKEFPADVELTGVEIEGSKYVQMVIRDITERERSQRQLVEANENLEQKVQERTSELNKLNIKMVDIARSAGMAEVASGVLHNVGNVLNSVNVSTSVLKEIIKVDKTDNLDRLAVMLKDNKENLAEFLENNEKGKLVIPFIDEFSNKCKTIREKQLNEIESLVNNVDHIKNIISMQQTYAGHMGVIDKIKARLVVEDAVNINISSIEKNNIELIKDYGDDREISVDKHKLIQILVNLISNAKYAVINSDKKEKNITIKITSMEDMIGFSVKDNGIGIEENDMTRLFEFGFKKRIGGHGYGLHHSALMAKELGGKLSVGSDGLGKGAVFNLVIPCL